MSPPIYRDVVGLQVYHMGDNSEKANRTIYFFVVWSTQIFRKDLSYTVHSPEWIWNQYKAFKNRKLLLLVLLIYNDLRNNFKIQDHDTSVSSLILLLGLTVLRVHRVHLHQLLDLLLHIRDIPAAQCQILSNSPTILIGARVHVILTELE